VTAAESKFAAVQNTNSGRAGIECSKLNILENGFRALSFPMKKELSPKTVLEIRCPTCGAAPGEKCELNTGQPVNHVLSRIVTAD
jgi:hypothetical protein